MSALKPIGLLVRRLMSRSPSRYSCPCTYVSEIGCTIPMPPASLTAATSSGLLHGYIGPQMSGTSMPTCVVNGVDKGEFALTVLPPPASRLSSTPYAFRLSSTPYAFRLPSTRYAFRLSSSPYASRLSSTPHAFRLSSSHRPEPPPDDRARHHIPGLVLHLGNEVVLPSHGEIGQRQPALRRHRAACLLEVLDGDLRDDAAKPGRQRCGHRGTARELRDIREGNRVDRSQVLLEEAPLPDRDAGVARLQHVDPRIHRPRVRDHPLHELREEPAAAWKFRERAVRSQQPNARRVVAWHRIKVSCSRPDYRGRDALAQNTCRPPAASDDARRPIVRRLDSSSRQGRPQGRHAPRRSARGQLLLHARQGEPRGHHVPRGRERLYGRDDPAHGGARETVVRRDARAHQGGRQPGPGEA